MTKIFLYGLSFIALSAAPVSAQSKSEGKDSVFTYDTRLHTNNNIREIDEDDLDDTDIEYGKPPTTYNNDVYNREEFEPEDSNPQIITDDISDRDDIYELDGNARIITGDNESDIIIID